MDRDGVINRAIVRNRKPCPPTNLAEIKMLPVVDEIHESLLASLGIDNNSACYLVGADNYDCRTPKPGGLVPAAEKHNIGLSRSFLVGD